MQLARAVRNRTTGVLYVLDEPSIGLHPSNIIGLTGVMRDLIADGNSVVLVDHDTQILSEADWIVEMGPKRVRRRVGDCAGGYSCAEKKSCFPDRSVLSGEYRSRIRKQAVSEELFDLGKYICQLVKFIR